jgi:hypothetical protein
MVNEDECLETFKTKKELMVQKELHNIINPKNPNGAIKRYTPPSTRKG